MTLQHLKPVTANDHLVSSPSTFVGRERELAFIKKQYEAVKGGNLRVVLLAGDLGIGKTRLLHEIAARAGQEGPIVLQGGASSMEGMPPYLPFLEALGRYIHETSLDQLRQQIAAPSQALVSTFPELAARLGDVAMPYPLPPEQARLRLYQAVGTTLEAISMPQTLILTLDDLHWADTASLNLLCYIAQHHSQARLLILGAYRESEIFHNPSLELAVNELIRLRVLTTIMLGPLSTTEIEELAASYIGGPLCPIVSERLYKQSEGNPFFAEELLRNWVEAGVIVHENTNWMAVASLEHSLPSSIVGALRQRFVRLSAEIIDHLRIAAIIGRTFDLSLLATVEGQEVEVVEECLLEATRAHLIQTDHAGVFTFSHEKIRECLYAEVSTSRRRRLHETIGRVLEARYAQETTPRHIHQLAELAFHFSHSGDRVRGVTYSWQAAEQALQSSTIEAIAHYRLALEMLTEDDERRGELLLGLGEALRLTGAEHEAAAAYERAVVHLLAYNKQQAAAQATSGLAMVEETVRREGPGPELARTLLALAELEERNERGDATRIKKYLETALALFAELNIVDAASRIRARLQSLTNGLTFQDLPANLTRREAEVLQLVATGKSNRQIAQELILSERTVANHLSHIFAKTGSENRVAATTFAIRHKLVSSSTTTNNSITTSSPELCEDPLSKEDD